MVRVAIGMNGHWRRFLRKLTRPFFWETGRSIQSRIIMENNGRRQRVRIRLEIRGRL